MSPKKTILNISAILFGLLCFMVSFDSIILTAFEINHKLDQKKKKSTSFLIFEKQIWNKFENKNEFEFKGHYYDVIEISETNSKVTATVIKDELELFLKLLDDIDKSDHPDKNKKIKKGKIDISNPTPVIGERAPTTHIPTSKNYFNEQLKIHFFKSKIFHPPQV